MLAVPFLPGPLSVGERGAVAGVLFVLTQVSFYAGVLLVGKEVIYGFIRKFRPGNWFGNEEPSGAIPVETKTQGNDQPDAKPANGADDEDNRAVEDEKREEGTH